MSIVDGPSAEREFLDLKGTSQMRKLYIASPFFNPEQLAVVEHVERSIRYIKGLDYYSPRNDGVLHCMTPAERLAAGPKLFKLNCAMVRECVAVIALMDYKDTGTTWETGFAFGIGKPVFGYRTDPSKPINVMLQQCFHAVVYGEEELAEMLAAYAAHAPLDRWEVRKQGEAY